MFRETAIAAVVVHVAIIVFHSMAHARLGISAPGWQGPFIMLVIMGAPLAAAALLVRRALAAGFALLATCMAGSLAFGAMFHFVLPGPDNVAEIPHHAWAPTFRASAMVLAATEAIAASLGAAGLVRTLRRRSRCGR